MYQKLSNIPIEITTSNEVINYLLDNGFVGIINDIQPMPNIQYDLNDLLQVWDILDLMRCAV